MALNSRHRTRQPATTAPGQTLERAERSARKREADLDSPFRHPLPPRTQRVVDDMSARDHVAFAVEIVYPLVASAESQPACGNDASHTVLLWHTPDAQTFTLDTDGQSGFLRVWVSA
jgi:hypothetical protein